MYLQGIGERDVQILDEMWSIDSRSDMDRYLMTLDKSDLRRALTLIELLKLSAIDDIVNAMDTYPEAEMMLRNIMN